MKLAPTSFNPYFLPNSIAFQCLLLSKVSFLRSGASGGMDSGVAEGSWNKRKAGWDDEYHACHLMDMTYYICGHLILAVDQEVCTVSRVGVSSGQPSSRWLRMCLQAT